MNTEKPSYPFDDYLELTKDAEFKAFFKERKELIPPLLEAFLPLPEGSKVQKVVILDPEMTSKEVKKTEGLLGKNPIIDLRVTFENKEADGKIKKKIANVEMQGGVHSHFSERLMYYANKAYADQLSKGQNYDKLVSVYSLAFMTQNLNDFTSLKDEYYHLCSTGREEWPHLRLGKNVVRHIIVELKKFTKSLKELKGEREYWSYFLKRSGKMEQREYENLRKKGGTMAEAVKHLEEISQNPRVRAILEAHEKQRRDQEMREMLSKEDGIAEGRAEGMEKGMEKGRTEGMDEKSKEVALNLMKKGLDLAMIAETTGLSEEDLKKMSKE